MSRLRLDPFLGLLIAVLLFSLLLPARGEGATLFRLASEAGIFLLFFLHGAKLSRDAILSGFGAWKLHLMVIAATFALFPLLGLALAAIVPARVLDPGLMTGVLFLCLLPSTVQSSIAFTSIAGGNVPAAICSASLSNLIGIFVTPLLASALLHGHAGNGDLLAATLSVATTLLLPFVLGHLARPLIGGWVDAHKALVMRVDRGAILLIVYVAFSAATVEGLWHRVDALDLLSVLVVDALLLALVLGITAGIGRLAGLPPADRTVLLFCGSKKSLASGVPMAGALFPPAQVGLIVVPLMLFHQLQLVACSAIAQRLARRQASPSSRPAPG